MSEIRNMANNAFQPLSMTEKLKAMKKKSLKESRDMLFSGEKVEAFLAIELIDDCSFAGKKVRIKSMKNEFDEAAEIADELTNAFSKASQKLIDQTRLTEQESKKTSSKVRQIAHDLQSALAKIEQQANFDRLERYVILLERAANAMQALSEIDKSGKLKKIADALK
jgi:hypothetical protein